MKKEYVYSVLIEINEAILGSKDTILNLNELESSVYSAFQTFGGSELFPSDLDKVLHVSCTLSASHCFKDANKRTTSIFLCTFLQYLGYQLNLSDKDLADLIIDLVSHKVTEEEFTKLIKDKISQY